MSDDIKLAAYRSGTVHKMHATEKTTKQQAAVEAVSLVTMRLYLLLDRQHAQLFSASAFGWLEAARLFCCRSDGLERSSGRRLVPLLSATSRHIYLILHFN